MLEEEVARTVSHTPVRRPSPERQVRNSLSTFVEQGINTSSWTLFAGEEPVRIVYIGTDVASLAHLVKSEQPLQQAIHYPFPQLRLVLPWKPKPDLFGSTLFNEETLHDVSSFPTRDVRDALVASYFERVHPGFPVIDEQDFLKHYNDPQDPNPLILFQAVLLAGAHVTDHPLVKQSRSTVKATLFRRTKALFNMRYENDRLFLISAALLMTWHQENSDNVSCNTYYWSGVACRIAFGLGLHRDLSPTSTTLMPLRDRQLYRRNWWALFQVEVFSALEHGRPPMIRLEDFDQPLLDDHDLLIEGRSDTNIELDYITLNIELCVLALEIIRSHAPGNKGNPTLDMASLDQRLAASAIGLPASNDMFSYQIRIHYNVIVIHAHRDVQRLGVGTHKQTESAKICSEAATSIVAIFETMLAQDLIKQCHFTCNMALMTVLVQIVQDFKSAINEGSVILALNAQTRLGRLIAPIKEVATFWPNTEAVLKLCQRLQERSSTLIETYMNESSPHQAVDDMTGAGDLWQELFSAYDNLDFGQNFPADGWMNSSANMGL